MSEEKQKICTGTSTVITSGVWHGWGGVVDEWHGWGGVVGVCHGWGGVVGEISARFRWREAPDYPTCNVPPPFSRLEEDCRVFLNNLNLETSASCDSICRKDLWQNKNHNTLWPMVPYILIPQASDCQDYRLILRWWEYIICWNPKTDANLVLLKVSVYM